MSTLYAGVRETEQDQIAAAHGVAMAGSLQPGRSLNYLVQLCAHSQLWESQHWEQPKLPHANLPRLRATQILSRRLLCFCCYDLPPPPDGLYQPKLKLAAADAQTSQRFPDLAHIGLDLSGMAPPINWRDWHLGIKSRAQNPEQFC